MPKSHNLTSSFSYFQRMECSTLVSHGVYSLPPVTKFLRVFLAKVIIFNHQFSRYIVAVSLTASAGEDGHCSLTPRRPYLLAATKLPLKTTPRFGGWHFGGPPTRLLVCHPRH